MAMGDTVMTPMGRAMMSPMGLMLLTPDGNPVPLPASAYPPGITPPQPSNGSTPLGQLPATTSVQKTQYQDASKAISDKKDTSSTSSDQPTTKRSGFFSLGSRFDSK